MEEGLDARRLIERAEEALKEFNPVQSTLDSHADKVLESGAKLCSQDKLFLKQVLYGCVRHKNVLKALLTSFYFNNSSTTSRADYTKYMIFSYLSIFRVEELGFSAFSRLIRSQAAEKMHVFLSYLFDKPTLERWVKDEWIKYYDLGFVEKTMIGNLDKFAPQVQELCEALSSEAFGLAEKREAAAQKAGIPDVFRKPPTIPMPFNITPARPTKVPEPFQIKQSVQANPIPKNLNNLSLSKLEDERKKARAKVYEETLKKYDSSQEFNLHAPKDTLTQLVEEKERQLNDILSKRFQANPVPDFDKMPAEVKMNMAAILREDALYKKKQAHEAKQLEAFESELRDSSDFYKWQEEMKKKDEEERVRLVEQRRTESAAAQEEARLAMQRQLDENRKVAKEMKQEKIEKAQEKVLKEQEDVLEKRKKVEEIQSTKHIPQLEKEKIVKKNRQVTREMRARQAKLEAEKRRREEEEQKKRNDLIRQIRALERVPVKKVTQFDPTESGNHGLLEEMSLLELKERLAINQMKEKKLQHERNKQILQEKKHKEKLMQERIVTIRRARDAAASANRKSRQRRREQDEELERMEQELKDEAKLKLMEKLAGIRQQREDEIQRLQDEEERVQKKNMFLGVAKEMVEQKAYEEFIKGAERKARETQKRAQVEARANEKLKRREQAIRAELKRKQEIAEQAAMEHAKAVFQESQRQNKEKAYALSKEKRQVVLGEQQRFKEAKKMLDGINPYATAIGAGPGPLN